MVELHYEAMCPFQYITACGTHNFFLAGCLAKINISDHHWVNHNITTKKHTKSTLVSIINCKRFDCQRVPELHCCLGVRLGLSFFFLLLIAILNSDFLQFIWLAVHIKYYMQDYFLQKFCTLF